MDGALTQLKGGDLANQAAGGDLQLADMFKAALANNQQRQSYLEQQQAAYNRDLEQYARMVEEARQPGYNDAGRWGAMAEAASRVSPQYGNLGAMLGQIGGAYGRSIQMEQAANLRNQTELTKMFQQDSL